jgi:hypothetical protein
MLALHNSCTGVPGTSYIIWSVLLLCYICFLQYLTNLYLVWYLCIFYCLHIGVNVFSRLATTWGGFLFFNITFYFAVGFISLFSMGGVTGILLSNAVWILPYKIPIMMSVIFILYFLWVLFCWCI